MNQPLLKCEHVDFGYENYDVVKDVSMEIVPGDYLCIVGENGSGKSTLMKGLLGLLKPTGGVLTIADELQRSRRSYFPAVSESAETARSILRRSGRSHRSTWKSSGSRI